MSSGFSLRLRVYFSWLETYNLSVVLEEVAAKAKRAPARRRGSQGHWRVVIIGSAGRFSSSLAFFNVVLVGVKRGNLHVLLAVVLESVGTNVHKGAKVEDNESEPVKVDVAHTVGEGLRLAHAKVRDPEVGEAWDWRELVDVERYDVDQTVGQDDVPDGAKPGERGGGGGGGGGGRHKS